MCRVRSTDKVKSQQMEYNQVDVTLFTRKKTHFVILRTYSLNSIKCSFPFHGK